jgi:hypothetical protein
MKKIFDQPAAPFIFLTVITASLFAQTFQYINSSLVDWRDHAFIVWVMSQNVSHMQELDFANFFNTNAYYPHTGTLFLSDLLIPQSMLMLPFVYILKDLIASFNIVLFLTVLFNTFASYLFWNRVFGKKMLAFAGSLLTAFSPFFHYNVYHFQMISFWPFFLSLYFLYGGHKNRRKYLLAGAFLSVQFLASAYLGVFLIAVTVLYLVLELFLSKDITYVKNLLIVIAIFIVIDGLFVVGYLNARQSLGVHTNYHEYVAYSAHLADYLFSNGVNSIIHNLNIVEFWNSFSKHSGATPGFTLVVLSLATLVKTKRNGSLFVGISVSKSEVFFLLLIIIGFMFSLGPRLQFNGSYEAIPLPYHFAVKYVPLVNSIRAPARWSFLVYLGLTYFALKFMSKIKSKNLFALIIFFIFLEYLPVGGIPSERGEYLRPKDFVLAAQCSSDPKVVLEIPVTHFDAGQTSIVEGLTYITKTELASTYHKCILVNGYSGFDLPSIQNVKENIITSLEEEDAELFYSTIENTRAELLVVNKEYMLREVKNKIDPILEILIEQNRIASVSSDVYDIR